MTLIVVILSIVLCAFIAGTIFFMIEAFNYKDKFTKLEARYVKRDIEYANLMRENSGYKEQTDARIVMDFDNINVLTIERGYNQVFGRIGTIVVHRIEDGSTKQFAFDTSIKAHEDFIDEYKKWKERQEPEYVPESRSQTLNLRK